VLPRQDQAPRSEKMITEERACRGVAQRRRVLRHFIDAGLSTPNAFTS